MSIRVWHLLAIAAFLGLASLMLVATETLLPPMPGVPALAMRAALLVQPALLTALALWTGWRLSPKLGLGAPLCKAFVTGSGVSEVLRRQVPLALLAGFIVAGILVAYNHFMLPILADAKGDVARLVNFKTPLPTRLLYGGLVEEIMTRWGLMTLLAWSLWRLASRPPIPGRPIFIAANAATALLFAAGHLPLLFALVPHPTGVMLAAVIIGNVGPGLLFGWLYWRRGLEAAMLAHATGHLIAWIFVPG